MRSYSPSIESNPESMSLREKSVWCCLISTVLVYTAYFGYAAHLWEAGGFRVWNLLLAMMGATFVQCLLLATGLLLFARRNLGERKDERDTALELRAARNAYWVFAATCYLLVIGVPVCEAGGVGAAPSPWLAALVVSQLVLLNFVLAEVVRMITLARGYRRGN